MHENVSSAEAKQYGLDRKLKKLLEQGKCLPLEIAVRRVLASWAASQLPLLLHFLQFTINNTVFLCPHNFGTTLCLFGY